MRPNKGGKRIIPQPGGGSFQTPEVGPVTYLTPMPESATPVKLVPVEEGGPAPPTPRRSPRPLIPSDDELNLLPQQARAAFAARCDQRAAALGRPDPAAGGSAASRAATAVLLAATTATPVNHIIRLIRRDFDRLARLAKANNWTDDTPVPPGVLGPLWPGDWKPEPGA